MTTLNAKDLTLSQVHHRLKVEEQPSNRSSTALSLEPLTKFDQVDPE